MYTVKDTRNNFYLNTFFSLCVSWSLQQCFFQITQCLFSQTDIHEIVHDVRKKFWLGTPVETFGIT